MEYLWRPDVAQHSRDFRAHHICIGLLQTPDQTVWAGVAGIASAPPVKEAPDAAAANEPNVDEEDAVKV